MLFLFIDPSNFSASGWQLSWKRGCIERASWCNLNIWHLLAVAADSWSTQHEERAGAWAVKGACASCKDDLKTHSRFSSLPFLKTSSSWHIPFCSVHCSHILETFGTPVGPIIFRQQSQARWNSLCFSSLPHLLYQRSFVGWLSISGPSTIMRAHGSFWIRAFPIDSILIKLYFTLTVSLRDSKLRIIIYLRRQALTLRKLTPNRPCQITKRILLLTILTYLTPLIQSMAKMIVL